MSNLFLITGGAGFIGSHLARRLVHGGERVRVIDNLSTGSKARLDDIRSAIEFIRGDLSDLSLCDQAVDGVAYVLHQAAVPSVQRSIQDPLLTNRSNVTATLNLLESARKKGIRRFVYASSSSAYGDTEILPKVESMPPQPLSPYALQKVTGERYCQLYYRLFGLQTVSLRYFNVFGPGQDPNSEYSAVIPKFIQRLLGGDSVVVYGDGEQSRDFTYIENVVDANLLALRAENAPGKFFNIGCGERITLNRLIRYLEEIVEKQARIEHAGARTGDVRHSLADISLAGELLGYRPKTMIKDGLRRTVEAFRSLC